VSTARATAGLFLLTTAFGAAAHAGELRGSAELEWRGFPETGADPDQSRASFSAALEPEYRAQRDSGRQLFVIRPFARIDSADSARSHVDLRELYWQRLGERWEWTAGVRRIFWGVTESQHLADVVNQVDFVEDPDEEDRLGQPLLSVARRSRFGRWELLGLPYFRERSFPGPHGRLRPPLPVLTDAARYEPHAGRFAPGAAVRWSRTVGGWDLGASHIAAVAREPLLSLSSAGLIPIYRRMNQTGIDVQVTAGPVLGKTEAYVRHEGGERFAAGTIGLEYTFGNVGGKVDVGAVGEYVFDTRGRTSPRAYQDDVFAGIRLGFNDPASTELLAAALVDRKSGGTFLSVEGSRRLGSRWKIAATLRAFAFVSPSDVLYAFRRDSYLQLDLSRHF
jgi:hypothetical protein